MRTIGIRGLMQAGIVEILRDSPRSASLAAGRGDSERHHAGSLGVVEGEEAGNGTLDEMIENLAMLRLRPQKPERGVSASEPGKPGAALTGMAVGKPETSQKT